MQEFHSVCPNLTWDQVWDEHCKTKIKQNNSQPNEISAKAMSFNVQYELFYDPIKTLLFFKEKAKKWLQSFLKLEKMFHFNFYFKVNKAFSTFDINSDGKLNYKEFCNMVTTREQERFASLLLQTQSLKRWFNFCLLCYKV